MRPFVLYSLTLPLHTFRHKSSVVPIFVHRSVHLPVRVIHRQVVVIGVLSTDIVGRGDVVGVWLKKEEVVIIRATLVQTRILVSSDPGLA